MSRAIATIISAFLIAACSKDAPPSEQADTQETAVAAVADPPAPPQPYAGHTAFVGATLWDGSGSRALENATLLVKDGRVVAVKQNETAAGADIVDVSGHYIIPGLINAHGHVSGRWAEEGVTDSAERVRGDLRLYARYGVTTVNSLGGEPAAVFGVRDAQNDPELNHARVYVAGSVVADADPILARATTTKNVALDVDWIKLRIDDNLGTGSKMPWPAVQAVFDGAKAAGKPVATHIFYADDALRALDMGSALIAHSVRDRTVDDAFVARLLNAGVCYVPTLTREVSTFVYAERPDFLDDPFFLEAANEREVARVSDPQFMARVRASASAAAYRNALKQAQENLRILVSSGVPVAFGTDSGPPGRFPGYFEHVEMFLMIQSGMTTREALLSATSVAADCLGLNDVGTLEAGKWADFLVLDGDPLDNVRATRSVQSVFIAGNAVPR